MGERSLRLFLLLFLVLVPFGSAHTYLIFNQTFASGGTVPTNFTDYTIDTGAVNTTTISLIDQNDSVYLSENECLRISHELLCYIEKEDEDARMTLHDRRAFFNFSLYTNATSFVLAGKELTGTIWMNNSGVTEGKDVLMLMPIPQAINVIRTRGCSHNDTHIYWAGRISSNINHDCKFTYATSMLNESFSFAANFSYATFGVTYSLSNISQEYVAFLPFNYSLTYDDLIDLEPAKPFSITVNVTNNYSDVNITIDELSIPKNDVIEFLSSTSTKVKSRGSEISGSTTLKPNQSFDPTIEMSIPYIDAEGFLEVVLVYNLSTEEITFRQYLPYSTTKIPLQINFSATNPLESFQSTVLNITATSLYERLTFKGYDITVSSSLFDKDVILKKPFEKSKRIVSLQITAPETEEDLFYPIEASLTATTSKGQTITSSKRYILQIIPLQFVQIEKTYELGNLSAFIDVHATNLHQEPITLFFEENLSTGIYASGKLSRTVTLLPNVSTPLYSYSVIAPNLTSYGGMAQLTTLSSYELRGETQYLNESLFIPLSHLKPPEVNVSLFAEPLIIYANQSGNESAVSANIRGSSGFEIVYLLIILAIVIGFTLYHLRFFFLHMYHLVFKHKVIVKQYEFLKRKHVLSQKNLDTLDEGESKLLHDIEVLENYVGVYDKRMDKEISLLTKEKIKIQNQNKKVDEKIAELEKKQLALQNSKNEFLAQKQTHEHELQTNENKQAALKSDEKMLNQDLEKLRSQLQNQKFMISKTKQLREDLKKSIASFGSKHVRAYRGQLDTLNRQRVHLGESESDLQSQEHLLKTEMDKIKKDLKLSDKDLASAEKIYKESKTSKKNDKRS